MKKTYIQPSIEEVKLNKPVLLAGSEKGVGENAKEWGAHEDEDEFDW